MAKLLKVIVNVAVPELLCTASLAVAVKFTTSPIAKSLSLTSAVTVTILGALSVVSTETSKLRALDTPLSVSVASTSTVYLGLVSASVVTPGANFNSLSLTMTKLLLSVAEFDVSEKTSREASTSSVPVSVPTTLFCALLSSFSNEGAVTLGALFAPKSLNVIFLGSAESPPSSVNVIAKASVGVSADVSA